MATKRANGPVEAEKQGFTSWLKRKFLQRYKEEGPVDGEFLQDLSDLRKVGRYEIVGKLGHGSMGVAYLGKHP